MSEFVRNDNPKIKDENFLVYNKGSNDLLLEECRISTFQTDFNCRYQELDKEGIVYFSKFLKNRTLYDLGCGFNAVRMVDFAMKCGCKNYKGVDIDDGMFKSMIEIRNNSEEYAKKINCEFNKKDMLGYLKEQKDNSGNITINGIDDAIIDPTKAKNKEYIAEVVKQIVRVIGKDYKVFGINSPVIFDEFKARGLNVYSEDDFYFLG